MTSYISARMLCLSLTLFLITMTGCDFFIPIPATFEVRESVEQLHVTGAEPGSLLMVVAKRGRRVAEGVADDLGSFVFRELQPGDDYRVASGTGHWRETSWPHTVLSAEGSLPDPSFYSDQVLQPGFNYITTRDGTTLSAYVYLPGPPEDGKSVV